MIHAGELRNQITIERRAPDLETFGGPPVWAEFATVWAKAVPSPTLGKENNLGDVVTDLAVTQFETRYLPGVRADMRINWDGRLYNITSVINENERNEKLILLAEEGENQG